MTVPYRGARGGRRVAPIYVRLPTDGRTCVRCGEGRYAGGRCSSFGLDVVPFARVLRAQAP